MTETADEQRARQFREADEEGLRARQRLTMAYLPALGAWEDGDQLERPKPAHPDEGPWGIAVVDTGTHHGGVFMRSTTAEAFVEWRHVKHPDRMHARAVFGRTAAGQIEYAGTLESNALAAARAEAAENNRRRRQRRGHSGAPSWDRRRSNDE